MSMETEMNIKEMEERFEGEWILVGNPHTDDHLNVLGGEVIHHSRDRDEVYRRAVELRPKRYAMLFTGKMPPNTAIVL